MYRIGFDAKRLFQNYTGLGNYSRTLVSNLTDIYPENFYYLYTPKLKHHPETTNFINAPRYTIREPSMQMRSFWRSYGVIRDLVKDKIDLYHGLSHEIPFGIEKTSIRTIVTIHDLIFRSHPAQYNRIDRWIYDYKFKYACEHANRIIAISNSTKNDIIKFYGIDPYKIDVVYQACHPRFQAERSKELRKQIIVKYNLPENFLLYVGSLIERKNLIGILLALSTIPEKRRIPLIVVGSGSGKYVQAVTSLINEEKLQKWVQFVQPDFEDLPSIYQASTIFIYPSYYEGFGIPILEALLSGVPVITSKTSSLPEAVGPGGILVDPTDSEEIGCAIIKLLENEALRQEYIHNGRLHAQKFNGNIVTEQLMNSYLEVLESPNKTN